MNKIMLKTVIFKLAHNVTVEVLVEHKENDDVEEIHERAFNILIMKLRNHLIDIAKWRN